MSTGPIVVTRPGARLGASTLGGLTHLLWMDASVRAVLVERSGTKDSSGEPEFGEYVDQVRHAIELTGSGAALLVSC